MREIKFRVWDKENLCRKMSYSNTEYFDDMMGFRFQHFDGDVEDLVFMQCTGFKDKNGVEIYEGDVCRLSNDTYYSNHYFNTLDDWKMVTKAVWEDQSFKFQDVTDRHASLFFFEADQDSIEIKIIGNIYENKELIGKENGNE